MDYQKQLRRWVKIHGLKPDQPFTVIMVEPEIAVEFRNALKPENGVISVAQLPERGAVTEAKYELNNVTQTPQIILQGRVVPFYALMVVENDKETL